MWKARGQHRPCMDAVSPSSYLDHQACWEFERKAERHARVAFQRWRLAKAEWRPVSSPLVRRTVVAAFGKAGRSRAWEVHPATLLP